MGEVLLRDEKPRDIWDQHEAILKAITKGGGARAHEPDRRGGVYGDAIAGEAGAIGSVIFLLR
jgi:hypothetical protein